MKVIAKFILYGWNTTYEKNSFSNDESANEIVNVDSNKPRFIEISKYTSVYVKSTIYNRNAINPFYKDVVTVEFGSDNLIMVMDLPRR